MKVLILTYPRIGLNRGGLQIQIEETINGLAQLGIKIVRFDPWQNQIAEADICHVFSIDGSMVYHAKRSVNMGKPVVVSPVFNIFDNPRIVTRLKSVLSGFVPGMYSDLKRANSILRAATRVIALNANERSLLVSIFGVPTRRCTVIPNGIDHSFSGGDPALFEQLFGVHNFVLNVASIERRKNQLALVRAMWDLPYSLVLIGKAASEQDDYLEQCRREAGRNVVFAGAFAHDDPMLASAYAAAKLFALPSYSEVMPLTLYEAAMAGCRVITSKNVPIAASLVSLVPTFDPDDTRELASLIAHEMKQPRLTQLQATVRAMPTWRQVCEEVVAVYEAALSEVYKGSQR